MQPPEKAQGAERAERAEGAERAERAEKAERAERAEQTEGDNSSVRNPRVFRKKIDLSVFRRDSAG